MEPILLAGKLSISPAINRLSAKYFTPIKALKKDKKTKQKEEC